MKAREARGGLEDGQQNYEAIEGQYRRLRRWPGEARKKARGVSVMGGGDATRGDKRPAGQGARQQAAGRGLQMVGAVYSYHVWP